MSAELSVSLCTKLQPDIVLMSPSLPPLGGLDTTRKIRQVCEQTHVILLSPLMSPEDEHAATLAGAITYTHKGAAIDELVLMIRTVHFSK